MTRKQHKDKLKDKLMDAFLWEVVGGRKPPNIKEKVMQLIECHRRRRRVLIKIGLSASVAAAAVLVLLLLLPHQKPPQKPYPQPQILGNFTLLKGKKLARGVTLRIGKQSTTLNLGGYCHIKAEPDTQITLAGQPENEEILLEKGSITCDVNTKCGSFTVTTPYASIEAARKLANENKRVSFQITFLEGRQMRVKVKVLSGVVALLSPFLVGRALLKAGEEKTLPGKEVTVQQVAEGNNAFSVELYKKLAQKENGNLFFSPTSIEMALAMTYAGARGQTAAQMKNVLHLPADPTDKSLHKAFGKLVDVLNTQKEKLKISVANSLWAQQGYPWAPAFTNLIQKSYKSGLFMVDFKNESEACRQRINKWVEEKTKEKIKNLIPPRGVDALTRLVLVNAIYFKGIWKIQFDKKDTKKRSFWLDAKTKKRVDMMYLRSKYLGRGKKREVKFRFYHNADDKFSALEMEYGDGETAMVVFLPDAVDGLADLEKSLTPKKLGKWLGMLDKMRRVKMDVVALPKFKMTWGTKDILSVLKEMGMADVTNFSGMTTKPNNLFISAVFHKAFVEVNEEGTEAAAATAVVMAKAALPRVRRFIADHPFLFLIRHKKTGTILFMGRVTNPATR